MRQYSSTEPPKLTEEVAFVDWLKKELGEVAKLGIGTDVFQYSELNAAPIRPRTGMTAFADGTNWNPASRGAGFHGYRSSSWRRFIEDDGEGIHFAKSGSTLNFDLKTTDAANYQGYAVPGGEPLSVLHYSPHTEGNGIFSIVAHNSKLQLRAETGANAGVNPQIMLVDFNTFGVPITAGFNQPGVGILADTDQRGGSSSPQPLNVNFVNLGGLQGTWGAGRFTDPSPSSVGSIQLNVMSLGDPANGESQGMLCFWQAEAANWADTTPAACRVSTRLGEVAGFGYCTGGFTIDEAVSINFYAEDTFFNTGGGGVSAFNANAYCPTNIVFRNTRKIIGDGQRVTHVFDYNGNHIIGLNAAANGNANGGATNALILLNTTAVPSTNVSGGIVYTEAGALKYRGSGGTVTTLGAA